MTDESTIPANTLRRVRGLLNKAENAGTEGEAEVYNARAQELISRYGIEAAMLDAGRDPRERPDVERKRIIVKAPYSRDKIGLLAAIATRMGCRVVVVGGYGGGDRELAELWGFPADVLRVELVYTSLLMQATNRVVHVRPSGYENVGAYRRAWWVGFTAAINRRIKAQEEQATAAAEATRRTEERDRRGALISVALVLVGRADLVESAVKAAYPDMKDPRKRVLSSDSGMRAGYKAGHEADMGDRGYLATGSGRKTVGG